MADGPEELATYQVLYELRLEAVEASRKATLAADRLQRLLDEAQFATPEQGGKASTAIQPEDIGTAARLNADAFLRADGTPPSRDLSLGGMRYRNAADPIESGDLANAGFVLAQRGQLDVFAVDDLPINAAVGKQVFVTDGVGGFPGVAVYDGTEWIVLTTGEAVSSTPNEVYQAIYDARAEALAAAAQATAAATAVQEAIANGQYASAAQGALADTAVQPSGLAAVATTGSYSDLAGLPVIPTSAADLGAAAAADLVTINTRIAELEALLASIEPPTDFVEITPSDTTVLSGLRGIRITVPGDLYVAMGSTTTPTFYGSVEVGDIGGEFTKVGASTTATVLGLL